MVMLGSFAKCQDRLEPQMLTSFRDIMFYGTKISGHYAGRDGDVDGNITFTDWQMVRSFGR
jgi:hypothetical protein